MAKRSPREIVLERVCGALGRMREAEPSPTLVANRPATARPQDLTAHFARAAEEAQAEVSIVSGIDAARRRVETILVEVHARAIVVSPDAALHPWSCTTLPAAAAMSTVVRFAGLPEAGRAEALAADAGITLASFGLADTGTLVACAAPGDHRLDSLLPPVHIALLPAARIVPGLAELLARLRADGAFDSHSAITFITGPSRTADIELTLTIGVHGPKKLFVIVVDEQAAPTP